MFSYNPNIFHPQQPLLFSVLRLCAITAPVRTTRTSTNPPQFSSPPPGHSLPVAPTPGSARAGDRPHSSLHPGHQTRWLRARFAHSRFKPPAPHQLLTVGRLCAPGSGKSPVIQPRFPARRALPTNDRWRRAARSWSGLCPPVWRAAPPSASRSRPARPGPAPRATAAGSRYRPRRASAPIHPPLRARGGRSPAPPHPSGSARAARPASGERVPLAASS